MTLAEFREKYAVDHRSAADEAIEIVMIRHNLSIREAVRVAFESEPKTEHEAIVLYSIIAETERVERDSLHGY